MSAIPGGAVNFDILVRADAAQKVIADTQNRVKRMADEVRRTKVDATPAIDTKRLQRDAEAAKRIIKDVQREADTISRARRTAGGMGGGLGGSATFGGGRTGGVGLLVAGGDTTQVGNVGAAAVLRAGVLFGTAATEIAIAARDMKAAAARGDLAGEVRAEAAKNAFARSMPFGIGQLGGNIRELLTGEQAGIDATMFDAERGDRKAAEMARQDARIDEQRQRVRAVQRQGLADAGMTGTQLELLDVRQRVKDSPAGPVRDELLRRETFLASKHAAELEVIEREHASKMEAIRDKAAADLLRREGFTIDAERELLLSGQRETLRAMENQALSLDAQGNHAGASRLRQQAEWVRQAQAGEVESFDQDRRTAEMLAQDQRGVDARELAAGAGEATLERAERQRRITQDMEETRFEARQAVLGGREATQPRAEMEAILRRATKDLAETEDAGLRGAIMERQAAELEALRLDLTGGGRPQNASVVADAMTTNFAAGADTKDQTKVLRSIETILKQMKQGGVALTS